MKVFLFLLLTLSWSTLFAANSEVLETCSFEKQYGNMLILSKVEILKTNESNSMKITETLNGKSRSMDFSTDQTVHTGVKAAAQKSMILKTLKKQVAPSSGTPTDQIETLNDIMTNLKKASYSSILKYTGEKDQSLTIVTSTDPEEKSYLFFVKSKDLITSCEEN